MTDAHGTYPWPKRGNITPFLAACGNLASALEILRNMGFRRDERLSRYSDDPLIRTTGCARRQLALDCGGDVSPYNGEVAIFKLEDIRAAGQRRGLRTARVRVRTNSSYRHDDKMRARQVIVKSHVTTSPSGKFDVKSKIAILFSEFEFI